MIVDSIGTVNPLKDCERSQDEEVIENALRSANSLVFTVKCIVSMLAGIYELYAHLDQ